MVSIGSMYEANYYKNPMPYYGQKFGEPIPWWGVLPSAAGPAIVGVNDDESVGECHADDKEPFAALAFKIATDPFVGNLTFFRVYSGILSSGDTIFNPVKGKKERIGRILQMHSNDRKEIKEVYVWDIAAGFPMIANSALPLSPSAPATTTGGGWPGWRVGS